MNVRKKLSMNKDWKFHPGDVLPKGEKSHAGFYGFCKAGGADGAAREDWDDGEWDSVDLPHDWVVGREFDKSAISVQGYKPRGIGWYRKRFQLEESYKGKHLILEFGGISTYSTIYFNGSVLERNWNGYNTFTVDITDRAFFGERPNTLSIRVDALNWEGWWYEGAGLYRNVWLHIKSPLHIAYQGIFVNPQKIEKDQWKTNIETTLENSLYKNTEVKIVSSILDEDGNCAGFGEVLAQCKGGEQCVIRQEICVNGPALWDIDAPKIYSLVSELYQNGILVDYDYTGFGYRTIRFCPEKGFYLNERPIKVKGTCNHQDHAGIGVALPEGIQEYRIRRLKDMGSNAYRCAHGNSSQELKDICDRLGMLLMEENRTFESSPESLKRIEGMVKQSRNHPSVVMYSIFNEEDLQGTPIGRKIAQKIIHAINSLDGTRPVTAAMNGGFLEDEGVADVLDVTGFNYALNTFDSFHLKFPNQPVIGSENNCTLSTRGIYESDAKRQLFSSYDEEKAGWGNTIRETWQFVNTRSFIAGLFVWTGFDYRGEPTPYEWPSINSHWGAMDTCGFAKDGFFLHKAFWTDVPMVHILPHWNWPGRKGQLIKVMTHTNCEEVELLLNGQSLGKKMVHIYTQATWNVKYTPGKLKMIGYNKGIEVAWDEVHTAGSPAALKIELTKEYLYGDGIDAMPLNVMAVDKEGNFVPLANNKVRFHIEGGGRVLGVGNGDPTCHEADIADCRSLFNGRCQVIIQSTEFGGNIKVIAEAEGLIPSENTIEVRPKEPQKSIKSVNYRFINKWRMTRDVFDERPDPNMEVSSTDMNTWESIELGYGPQNKFDCTKGYAVYRTTFEISEKDSNREHILFFYRIMGTIEVYINGERVIDEMDCTRGSNLEVPIKAGVEGKVTISVLLRSGDWMQAGICNSVILK